MSKPSDDTVRRNEFTFPEQQDGETFVQTLIDHRGFCTWCLAPLKVNPAIQFPGEPEARILETAKTFTESEEPLEDVVPPKTDTYGQLVETPREQTICGDCGQIDTDPEHSRSKETTNQALEYVLSILDENGTDVTPVVARAVVNEAFEKGHTGQFLETLGTATHRSTE